MSSTSLRNWQPDSQQVHTATVLLLAGAPHELIAQAIKGPNGKPLSVSTFRRVFANQCAIMGEMMNASVIRSLFTMATSGGEVRAATFWVMRMDNMRARAEERALTIEGKAEDQTRLGARTLPPREALEAMSLDDLHRLARERVGADQSRRA